MHDRRQTSRIHPATWILLTVMTPAHLLAPVLGGSALMQESIGPALVEMIKIAPQDQ